MRGRIFPRILWFLLLNCVIFVLLVAMQFTRGGNFTHKIGDMVISGRYSAETNAPSEQRPSGRKSVDGGASVVFGGLEFRLSPNTGLCLVDSQEQRHPVSPEYITFTENGVTFTLSGGTELSFIYQNGGTSELQINGTLANDTTIEIPFRTQRASVIRNNNNNTLNILYNGDFYQFNRPLPGLELGQLVLAAAAPAISYRIASGKKEFNPVDFIVPQAETVQAFSGVLTRWINHNFTLWDNMGLETDEDTVIAWCGEAVRQGSYRSAVSTVPISFSSSPLRTWESAVYQFDRRIGVWERAARAIGNYEREHINQISRLLTEKNSSLFTEHHLIEFLAIRDLNPFIDNLLSFAEETDPYVITLGMSPGILENCFDVNKWRPDAENPFEPLAERVYQLVADGLHKDEDQIFVFSDDRADTEFNLRLGMAIHAWGEKSGNNEWAALGRSLILSVISLSDDTNGSIPASLVIGGGGVFAPFGGRASSAKLYRLLNDSEYLPHWTATGTSNIWAWTAASSVNIVQNNTFMDILIRFPVGETHYIMLRNVRPFPLLQIYEMSWRRAIDFESYYNSSGWYYFEQEQILVIKINQRSNAETVRIYYTVPRAPEPEPASVPPPPEPEPQIQPQTIPMEQSYQY